MRNLPSGAPPGAAEDARLHSPATEWFTSGPSGGAHYYLLVLKARLWLILLFVGVTLAMTVAALSAAEKKYEAEADLLIIPLPRDSADLIGLGLIFETSDPTRNVETVSRLVATPEVALRARNRLSLQVRPRELLKNVQVTPVAESNVVSITARAANPELAAALANAFGQAAVADRTARLQTELRVLIPRLRAQLDELPPSERPGSGLASKLRTLEALQAGDKDPTLRLESRAEVPTDPVSPRVALSIAAALLGALVIGAGGALGMELLNMRVRCDEQLSRYRIPILARIPNERKRWRRRRGPLRPQELSLAALDAYQLLGATLSAGTDDAAGHAVFVTGPTPDAGKTTTSINLAASLAGPQRVQANKGVILIDGDSRRPSVGPTLRLEPEHGVTSVLSGQTPLKDALVRADGLAPRVRVLLQEREEGVSGLISPSSAETLLLAAEHLADWVVLDAPVLNLVPDALAMAKRADSVVLVVRFGRTLVRDMDELVLLLIQQGIVPAGLVVVGAVERSVYYYRM